MIALAMIALLDLLTPPDVDFAEFYVLPVALIAWAYGWRAGLLLAGLVTGTVILVDSPLLRATGEKQAMATVAWNAVSDFVVCAVVAVVTDQVFAERRRSRAVNEERASLLRLLERELPRPLRSIDWFVRTFDEHIAQQLGPTDTLRRHVVALGHHVREVNFLASDLIRLGRLRSGELVLAPGSVDLKSIASDAASHVLERDRVLFSASPEAVTVRADAEAVHHAISSVIGRLIEYAPAHDVLHVFTRRSGDEGVVEFTSRVSEIPAGALELADLLTQANGGRLAIIPRGGDRGVRVNLYLPRATDPVTDPPHAAIGGTRA
jgi:signal transduction histidine kinase